MRSILCHKISSGLSQVLAYDFLSRVHLCTSSMGGHTYSRVWIDRVRLPTPFAPENLVSRDGFGSLVPRQPAHLHTQAESGPYMRDSSRVPRRRPFIYLKPPYAIGSVPSLSGHIAYRWRSLPRVRRHRASKPQGSSEQVLPWQVTMDQLICASLSHTHYWYEVGMLKVPRFYAQNPAFEIPHQESVKVYHISSCEKQFLIDRCFLCSSCDGTLLSASGNLFKCHEEVLHLQPLIPPKRLDIFPP